MLPVPIRTLAFSLITLITIFFLGVALLIADSSQKPDESVGIEIPDDFVQVEGANFILNGERFRFVGTNAYYLPNFQKLNESVVQRAFDLFEESEIKVIRMWAFYDGYDCGYSQNDPNESVIQTAPGIYDEQALRYLDQVIAEGKRRGIRFILPFVNYWDELGGICQYNTWAGAESPSRNMMFFIQNEDTQKWFRDYIEMLLNRINTVTGVAYKDEPAIMSWQIMNEGRNSGQNPRILRDWYAEMADFIKNIAPYQLLGTGEEGFDEGTPAVYSRHKYSNTYTLRANEGTSYIMNTSISGIDYGNAHWYSPDFGFGHDANEASIIAQSAWLDDHQRIAASAGKPFILGEYGFPGWGDERVIKKYDALWTKAEEIDLDGSLLWQLTADYVKCYEFGGNICWPGAREDKQLYEMFVRHIRQMQ